MSVILNETFSHIIHLVLVSNLTMLVTINRVSETFSDWATVAMTVQPRTIMECSLKSAYNNYVEGHTGVDKVSYSVFKSLVSFF